MALVDKAGVHIQNLVSQNSGALNAWCPFESSTLPYLQTAR